MKSLFASIFFLPFQLSATYFANPALPTLQIEGLIKSPPTWYCLRGGYMADTIYRQRYEDEFASLEPNPSTAMQMQTSAGTLTLNFENWLDLNVLLGSSQLQIDQEEFSKRQFSWGIGTKFLIFNAKSLFFGCDLKYFESSQKPLYMLFDGYACNVVSNFKLNYSEMQAALGASYRVDPLCPYIYLSYIYSKIQPVPLSLLVQIPQYAMTVETSSRSTIAKRKWGMAVGATLIGGAKGSITIESRFFNQNAINISGEVRF